MAYGGLKFDVSLLKCACLQWQQRFAAHQTAAAAIAVAADTANSTAMQSSSVLSRQPAAASAQATQPEPAATSTTSTAGDSVVDSSKTTYSTGSAAVSVIDDAVLRTAGCEPFSYMSAAARAALYDTSTAATTTAATAAAAVTAAAAAAVTAVTAAASASSPWLLLLGRLYSNCGIDGALLSEVLQHVHSSAAVSAADGTTAASDTISSTGTSSSGSSSSDAVRGFQSAAHIKQQQQQQQQQHQQQQPLQPLLREEHTHPAGIDFHVSNVLQDALRAPGAAAAVRRALRMSSGDDGALQDAMRGAMWRFSSGVNVRTPLIASTSSSNSSSSDDADSGDYSEQQLAAAWAVVKEPVQAAALHTIRSRLAS
jgi:hypothetical protein